MTGAVSASTLPQVVESAPWLRRFPVRTPTLPPATHTNVYVVGDGTLLVVDPASPYKEEQVRLSATLRELLGQGHRVSAILLTHHHADHISGADALRGELGVPILAHRETSDRVLARHGLRVDRLVDEGEVLPFGPAGGLLLLTPGHAPGHLCLWDQAGAGIVVGDMVASEGTILVDPADSGDMGVYLSSLERLLQLGAQRLWPAHGAAVEDGPGLLRHYIRHRLLREAKVVAALEAGQGTLLTLLPRAYDDVPAAAYPLAARSLAAHLGKLLVEGRACCDAEGVYRLASKSEP